MRRAACPLALLACGQALAATCVDNDGKKTDWCALHAFDFWDQCGSQECTEGRQQFLRHYEAELEYDEEFIDDLCGSCTACIDSCPTNALGDYEIYAEKCISYFTIEHRGEFTSNTELHNWIYGCDICQEVCPWNKKFAEITNEEKFKPRDKVKDKSLVEWSNLSEEGKKTYQ